MEEEEGHTITDDGISAKARVIMQNPKVAAFLEEMRETLETYSIDVQPKGGPAATPATEDAVPHPEEQMFFDEEAPMELPPPIPSGGS